MSYFSNFQELNGGYVAFGDNPKGGKISGKGKIKIGKLDFEDVDFVKELKFNLFNLFSVSQMTPQQNGIAERKNRTLIKAARTILTDSLLPIPFWAEAVNTACYVQNRKKDKGKSHVEYFIGNRDFNADFEDYSKDISNDVSAAGPIVPAAGQNFSNNTNPISAAGPSNTNTSQTHGKSSLQDASQMLEREDITYFDHENVGGEADFNNLETSIT
nr:putative ribonuclease H-like domain-containing protein [Tanacetum cinerariifolium]